MMINSELRKMARQLKVMLWKVSLIRLSHPLESLVEFLIPLLTVSTLIFVIIKLNDIPDGYYRNNTQVPAEAFPYPEVDFYIRLASEVPILYAPRNNLSTRIMDIIQDGLLQEAGIQLNVKSFSNPEDLNQEYLSIITATPGSPVHGIIFGGEDVNSFTYTIRSTMSGSIRSPFVTQSDPKPYKDSPYAIFSRLQAVLNLAYLIHKFPEFAGDLTKFIQDTPVSVYRLPYPSQVTRKDFEVTDLTPSVIIFGFIITYILIIKRLTVEKCSQIREMYRIAGLNDCIYWLTHLVDNYTIFLIQSAIITALLTLGIATDGKACVFNHTSPFMVFSVLALWGLNAILSAFALSIPFSRPVMAIIVGVIFWTSQVVASFYIDPMSNPLVDIVKTKQLRLISCLFPNMALTLAIRVITQKEIYGHGAGLSNLFEETSLYGHLTLGVILIILCVSSLLYIPVIYYLVNVIPTQYGLTRSWLFPIYSLFGVKETPLQYHQELLQVDQEYIEPLTSINQVKISLRNLFKRYDGSSHPSVENVSMDIPDKEITMLLGENGAGKTTLMSMIIGIIRPTRGKILIDGRDISMETDKALKSLAFCPQRDILHPELSVKDHLTLYGTIKGISPYKLELVAGKVLADIRLENFKHLKPFSLSGGMRRRLALGIALMGDSEIIILDEPTSGLDPDSRRAVWDILNEIKSNKTIVMTTHFIEEADAIGDRIAILRKGSLACFGSPMFLKKIFGAGYELRIAKSEESNVQGMINIIQTYFPMAEIRNAAPDELIFNLPQEIPDKSTFSKLFRELETKKDDLKISSWGLGYTTLEDVFIRVIQPSDMENTEDEIYFPKMESKRESVDTVDPDVDQVLLPMPKPDRCAPSTSKSFYKHLKALIFKRFHYSKRNWKFLLVQILVPLAVFASAMLLDHRMASMSSLFVGSIHLGLHDLYGPTKSLFANPSGDENVAKFGRVFQSIMAGEKAQVEILHRNTTTDEYMLGKASLVPLNSYIVGMESAEDNFKLYINGEATHALPLAVNLFFETLLRNMTSSISTSSTPPAFNFNVINQPFASQVDLDGPILTAILRPKQWNFLIQVTMPFLIASFVLIPIHERTSKAKLLQMMTGLNPVVYWFAHFIFDITVYVTCTGFIFTIALCLDSERIFIDDKRMQVAFILPLVTSGFASIPLIYIFSFAFNRPMVGYSALVVLFLLFGVVMAVIDLILTNLIPKVLSMGFKHFFHRVVGLFPLHMMSTELVRIFTSSIESRVCDLLPSKILDHQCRQANITDLVPIYRCCPDLCSPLENCLSYRDPISWNHGILPGLLELLCESFLFFGLLLLLELHSFHLPYLTHLTNGFVENFSSGNFNHDKDSRSEHIVLEDSDVTKEAERVRKDVQLNLNSQDSLTVVDLMKKYRDNWAVQGLTFGIRQNECFGLLGVNGAGKSTTFKMLVGEIPPSHGNAYIDRFNLMDNRRKFQQCIGYCPQYDALIDRLTAREMLFLFARLRGMEEKLISGVADQLIKAVNLERYANKMTQYYSGGNKRKLSIAIALIGNPRVIFLDEPSSGVDSGNRRRLWSVLSNVRESGCSIVLTSHSMGECEALCSRLAIMINGKLQCLGSLQHLRHKFGQGYSLYIKIKRETLTDPDYLKRLRKVVENTLDAELKQHHLVNLFYHIKDKSIKWSDLFQAMEDIKLTHQLEDYVISDTSLDQIFMQFARDQVYQD